MSRFRCWSYRSSWYRHVVAVVAAIELEGALIVLRSGHLSGRGHAYLQDGKRGRVAAQVRYQQQRIAGDRGANGRIHRLQLRSRRSRDFHRGRSGADFQHHVERERQPTSTVCDLTRASRKPGCVTVRS